MSEMIERVARAIYASEGNRIKPADGEWRATTLDDEEEEYRGLYYDYARAAIEAMREPTQDMKEDVRLVGGTQALAYGIATWPTMIDAALKEKP